MSTFHAYVKSDRVPTINDLIRALNSRGFIVGLEGDPEAPLTDAGDALAVTVGDEQFTIGFGTDADASFQALAGTEHAAPDTFREVLRLTDVRMRFTAEGTGETWARDMARNVALLSCGAFENPHNGTLLHYGR
jgi:hypothetical protein